MDSSPASRVSRSSDDWRTTDAQERAKRLLRGSQERMKIRSLTPEVSIYGDFEVIGASGSRYEVEIRGLPHGPVFCTCPDFRVNGLGICKHAAAVIRRIEPLWNPTGEAGVTPPPSPRIEMTVDLAEETLRIERGLDQLPPFWKKAFSPEGILLSSDPTEVIESLQTSTIPNLRISRELTRWLSRKERLREGVRLRQNYEQSVHLGKTGDPLLRFPLYPYQREGMLHLAFRERALLADEMGLGKTVQAIAASLLLKQLGSVQRVLIITPASLKTKWLEEVELLCDASVSPLGGASSTFFHLAHYEQIPGQLDFINQTLRPELIILDEAQRIKNWETRTAQTIKRLQSRYAFVLTGTPIENRLDDLYSLMDFLDPELFGPLFRFNREYYEFNSKGRPCGYRNLDRLRERLRPYLLRRKKADVEHELPNRTDRYFTIPLPSSQRPTYLAMEQEAKKLLSDLNRSSRPENRNKLFRQLTRMRLFLNGVKPENAPLPKVDELERILESTLAHSETKVIVFSEWQRVLEAVRERAESRHWNYAWHTGRQTLNRRREAVQQFRTDPDCRLFLSTDAGSMGLDLPQASVVIHCDLPWTATRIEQRIARAWRPTQTRSVTSVFLVCENTLEHRMLTLLKEKRSLVENILDAPKGIIRMPWGESSSSVLQQARALLEGHEKSVPTANSFREFLSKKLGPQLVRCQVIEKPEGKKWLVIVSGDPTLWRPRVLVWRDAYFSSGKVQEEKPVEIEIIDLATHELIQRLQGSGMI